MWYIKHHLATVLQEDGGPKGNVERLVLDRSNRPRRDDDVEKFWLPAMLENPKRMFIRDITVVKRPVRLLRTSYLPEHNSRSSELSGTALQERRVIIYTHDVTALVHDLGDGLGQNAGSAAHVEDTKARSGEVVLFEVLLDISLVMLEIGIKGTGHFGSGSGSVSCRSSSDRLNSGSRNGSGTSDKRTKC